MASIVAALPVCTMSTTLSSPQPSLPPNAKPSPAPAAYTTTRRCYAAQAPAGAHLQAPPADLLLCSSSSGTPLSSCQTRRSRRSERGLLHGIHGRCCLLPLIRPLWVPRPPRRTDFRSETKRGIQKIDLKMEDEAHGSGTRLGVLKVIVAHGTNPQRPLRRRPSRGHGQSKFACPLTPCQLTFNPTRYAQLLA